VPLLRAPIRVGVGVLVIENGRALLVKRRNPPSANMWSLPGGHLEPGESILEAAERELEEETGVRAKALGIIDITDLFVRDQNGALATRYVIIDVIADPIDTSRLKAGSDAMEAKFHSLEEILSLDLTPSTRKFFEKLLSRGFCQIYPSNVTIMENIGLG
jgi:ADP-ribose pyrophosphatase YjhB (NUDIX family)